MKSGNWQKHRKRNPLQRFLIHRFHMAIGDMLEDIAPASLLDVGCAEGFALDRVRRILPQAQLVGIDRDAAALQRGHECFAHLDLREGDLFALPFDDAAFDVVQCLEVLEHQTDPESALQCLKQVTRRYLLLSVPFEPFFCMANLLRGKNIMRLGSDPEHVQYWNPCSFRRLLHRQNLRVLSMRFPFPWMVFLVEKTEE